MFWKEMLIMPRGKKEKGALFKVSSWELEEQTKKKDDFVKFVISGKDTAVVNTQQHMGHHWYSHK